MSHSKLLLPVLATTLAAFASAQSLVLPDNCNLIGPTVTTSTWRSTAGHFQLAYDSTNFTAAGVTGPIAITHLRFRAHDGQPDLGGNVFSGVTVQLGDCAVDHMVMSSTFATNRGAMGTVGTTTFTLTPAGGGVPNDYVIDIDLGAIGAAYLYDPTTGNDLLIEITHNVPVPSTNLVTFAAGSGTLASARGRMLTTSSLTATTGSLLAPPVVEVQFAGPGGYAAHMPARLERIGHACGGTFQSFYQDFQPSEPFDLANTSITMIPNSVVAPTSYTVVAGTTPPDFTKLNLTPNSIADTAVVSVPLGFTFPYMSGSTTSIGACTDGYVWLDPAMTIADATPTVLELIGSSVAQTARVAPLWFNFHAGRNTATHPNAGLHVLTDPSGGPGNNVCYVTWYKVGLSATTAVGGASVSDMQCVLYEATGVIEMRYGQMQVGPGTIGITGFSPGRIGTVPSFHPGPRNLSHELPFITGPDSGVNALSHGTSTQARPVIGTSITFQSYNQPANEVLGLLCLDVAATEPAVNVPGLMAPGCGISMSSTFLIQEVVVAPPSTWTSLPLAIQPTWLGLQFYSQYFASDANLQFTSSNGLRLTVGLN
jgi:hypothetical protein